MPVIVAIYLVGCALTYRLDKSKARFVISVLWPVALLFLILTAVFAALFGVFTCIFLLGVEYYDKQLRRGKVIKMKKDEPD